jgi:hypothetical protein
MVKFIFLLSVLVLCMKQIQAQSAFFGVYSLNGYDSGADILELEDGGFLMLGASNSINQMENQLFVGKIGPNGNMLWSKDFGGSEIEMGKKILKIGNTFYLCGTSSSTINGHFDFLMLKMTSNGNFENVNYFGSTSWEFLADAIVLPDSSIWLAGRTDNSSDGLDDAWMIHVDSNGAVLDAIQSQLLGHDEITSLAMSGDSILYVAGNRFSIDSNYQRGYISAYSTTGTLIWDKEYGDLRPHEINKILVTEHGLYAVGSHFISADTTWKDYYIRLQLNGNIVEVNHGFDIGDKRLKDIAQISTYKYFLAGDVDNQYSFAGGTDVSYFRYTETLDYDNSAVELKVDNPDKHGSMRPTSDGGFVTIGTSSDLGFGDVSIYVLKIGPNSLYPDMSNPEHYVLVGLNEVTQGELEVYPNPTDGVLELRFPFEANGEVALYDLSGKLVRQEFSDENSLKWDVNNLEKGMYLLKYSSGSGQITKRIIKN